MACRLIAILLLACLGGCAPKAGARRFYLYFDRQGRASVIDVTVCRVILVPALD